MSTQEQAHQEPLEQTHMQDQDEQSTEQTDETADNHDSEQAEALKTVQKEIDIHEKTLEEVHALLDSSDYMRKPHVSVKLADILEQFLVSSTKLGKGLEEGTWKPPLPNAPTWSSMTWIVSPPKPKSEERLAADEYLKLLKELRRSCKRYIAELEKQLVHTEHPLRNEILDVITVASIEIVIASYVDMREGAERRKRGAKTLKDKEYIQATNKPLWRLFGNLVEEAECEAEELLDTSKYIPNPHVSSKLQTIITEWLVWSLKQEGSATKEVSTLWNTLKTKCEEYSQMAEVTENEDNLKDQVEDVIEITAIYAERRNWRCGPDDAKRFKGVFDRSDKMRAKNEPLFKLFDDFTTLLAIKWTDGILEESKASDNLIEQVKDWLIKSLQIELRPKGRLYLRWENRSAESEQERLLENLTHSTDLKVRGLADISRSLICILCEQNHAMYNENKSFEEAHEEIAARLAEVKERKENARRENEALYQVFAFFIETTLKDIGSPADTEAVSETIEGWYIYSHSMLRFSNLICIQQRILLNWA
jgi:hypothetical protein